MHEGLLAGRAALITGAAEGIGRGMALRFAKAGGAVLVVDFNAEKGAATTEELRSIGAKAEFFQCDVTQRPQMEAAVAACVDRLGSIDILVNNAYRGGQITRIEKKSDEEFDQSMAICLYAAKWSMEAALPHMKAQRWGRIINMCSLNGTNAHMGTADYNVGKEALRTYTRSAAREWAPYGICANIICPGAATAGFLTFKKMQPEVAAASEAANPMGRLGDPETDIGGVALFLASEDARYLTGNTLHVGGGSHINGVAWNPDLGD
ncbi:NAD(P)-dependent dehydrogenase (short-subunit alcohol dehydrogenase family) [Sphingobium sp. OAS761]|uniref:SDR family NAD(P)-dependent oxidoreductase n=1 Tax=Sphingobium sp. OAS761 TaxID=2817901 RepID=UPI00209F9F8F|nr:SDR family NAD(P)-dependent oxidoreductase [Sphingobium sp. OAS761]MCP1471467.1 NAD(P)-dependent dehydrogenase (short-subunit alcohol dehydrogenase family) [Sphingobium sp. OAS761]